MKKTASIAFAAMMAATLAGCASPEPGQPIADSQNASEQNQAEVASSAAKPSPEQASVGDRIELSTKYGDIAVTVDGFVLNEKMAEDFAKYGQIQEGKTVGLLQLTVENVSFKMNDNGDIPLSDFVYAEDSSGVAMTVMDSAFNNGDEYRPIAGGYCTCQQGKTIRVAIPCVADPVTTEVTAVAGDYEVKVPVA